MDFNWMWDCKSSVSVEDFKVVANWIDASDCLEAMGVQSKISHLFCHVNDDSLKLSARGIYSEQITIYQGNSGSAVSLGAYGKNRGTSGAGAYGVYIHRLMHSGWCDASGSDDTCNQYDNLGGMIGTRTCPTQALSGEESGLLDVTVDSLKVLELRDWDGDKSFNGCNTVVAAFSIAVLAKGGFCSSDDLKSPPDPYVVKGITLSNWVLMTNPRQNSIVYTDWDKTHWATEAVDGEKMLNIGGLDSNCQGTNAIWISTGETGPNTIPSYLVCGRAGSDDGCVGADGAASSANICYVDNGADFSGTVEFPCGFGNGDGTCSFCTGAAGATTKAGQLVPKGGKKKTAKEHPHPVALQQQRSNLTRQGTRRFTCQR